MFAEVDELAFLSKNLYNRANYEIRQHFFKTGKILSYAKIDKLLQNEDSYKALPSKVSQQILMLLDKNWKAWQEADKEYQKTPSKFLVHQEFLNTKTR
jgi:transposase